MLVRGRQHVRRGVSGRDCPERAWSRPASGCVHICVLSSCHRLCSFPKDSLSLPLCSPVHDVKAVEHPCEQGGQIQFGGGGGKCNGLWNKRYGL